MHIDCHMMFTSMEAARIIFQILTGFCTICADANRCKGMLLPDLTD